VDPAAGVPTADPRISALDWLLADPDDDSEAEC
jgi:hypothetical protein